MSSIIKVNTFQDANGNALFNSDGSGNVTLSSSGMKATPSFEAYLSSNQSISNNTHTKVQFDTEFFDTDGCYDNSTNYRFTPTVSGKYFIYANIEIYATTNAMQFVQASIYKNGTQYKQNMEDNRNANGTACTVAVYSTLDLNGSSDYVEIYGKGFTTGVTPNILSQVKCTTFGAYRIIGA